MYGVTPRCPPHARRVTRRWARVLLGKGADIEKATNHGLTPRHATDGQGAAVRLLLQHPRGRRRGEHRRRRSQLQVPASRQRCAAAVERLEPARDRSQVRLELCRSPGQVDGVTPQPVPRSVSATSGDWPRRWGPRAGMSTEARRSGTCRMAEQLHGLMGFGGV